MFQEKIFFLGAPPLDFPKRINIEIKKLRKGKYEVTYQDERRPLDTPP